MSEQEVSPNGAVMVSRRQAITLSSALIVAACSSAPPAPPPAVLDLKVSAGKDQNPDPQGTPAPVAIKIFQLVSTGAFNGADIFALSNNAAATLGADLLGSEQILVAPGDAQEIKHPLKPGALFLGVIVLFRDVNHATWRATAPLATQGPTALQLKTSKLSVTLVGAA